MARIFLIFGTALIALMAGALFFAAQAPINSGQAPNNHGQAHSERGQAQVTHPTFALPDADGAMHNSSEWDGKYRLLNFWATWCPPCRREIPLLKEFQDSHSHQGIQVLGIAVDFPEEVAAYAEHAKFNYPVLVGDLDALAIADDSGIDSSGFPFTMFLDRDGLLLGAHYGELHPPQFEAIADVFLKLENGEMNIEAASRTLSRL